MRKLGWALIIAGLLLGLAHVAAATDAPPPRVYTAGDKLARGLANIFTGFIEVPRNIHNTTEQQSLLAGWTIGVGQGLGYMGLRMLTGCYDLFTFPFPLPKDYAPVVEPEFVWQEPGPRYK